MTRERDGIGEFRSVGISIPNGGINSYGIGGAIDWKTTEKFTTSVFGEYARLVGPAADSSLVEQRGSPNQFTIGVSASYRFDFTM